MKIKHMGTADVPVVLQNPKTGQLHKGVFTVADAFYAPDVTRDPP